MNKLLQKLSIASAALVLGLSTVAVLPARAETIVRLGHSEGEGDLLSDPYWAFTEVFAPIVERGTQGRYKIQVFPNKQLGDLESMLEQNVRGDLQIVAGVTAGQVSAYAKSAEVLEMPYTFPTTEVARKVLNGPFGKKLSETVAKEGGIRILSYLPSAFRNFSNSVKPIKSPEDMAGLKMRTMQIPIHVKMVEALGASPTPIAWGELYSALQTGVVDGEENAPYVLLLGKLQEVQKYYTLDHHLLNTPLVSINEAFFESLSPEDQKVFEYAAREASFAFLGLVTAKESQDLKNIAAAGVEIYQPTSDEMAAFVAAVKKPIGDEMAKVVGDDLVGELQQAITDAEKEE